MFKEISIQRVDGSDDTTPILANAATPLRYKHIFGDDLLTKFANAKTTDENGSERYQIDFLGELAFVMAMQAAALTDKSIKLEKLNSDKFLDWLEQYEGMAIENAAEDILNVYLGNVGGSSEAKKNNEGQSES